VGGGVTEADGVRNLAVLPVWREFNGQPGDRMEDSCGVRRKKRGSAEMGDNGRKD